VCLVTAHPSRQGRLYGLSKRRQEQLRFSELGICCCIKTWTIHKTTHQIIVTFCHYASIAYPKVTEIRFLKMAEPKAYPLPPTKLIPNSPYPLLHYPGFFQPQSNNVDAVAVHDTFGSNGWDTQWIFRYGQTQKSHYHSQAHECMAVLSGEATIRFGVADTDNDLDRNTYGDGKEDGGVELHAKAGDVFIIPAGGALSGPSRTMHKLIQTTQCRTRHMTPAIQASSC
jgi:uncharacterized protein YjlB